jgi:hypothetical protein
MLSLRTLRVAILVGAVTLVIGGVAAQPRADARAASDSRILGSWLVTTPGNSAPATIVTFQRGLNERGNLIMVPRLGTFAPVTGEWTRVGENQYRYTIHAFRPTADGELQIERTRTLIAYNPLHDTWVTVDSYTQYLDSAMTVVGARYGLQTMATRLAETDN